MVTKYSSRPTKQIHIHRNFSLKKLMNNVKDNLLNNTLENVFSRLYKRFLVPHKNHIFRHVYIEEAQNFQNSRFESHRAQNI